MADILKGAPAAAALAEKLMARVEALKTKGVVPTLAILRVGQRPDDLSYEAAALRRCEKIGIQARPILLPEDSTREALLDAIRAVNQDRAVHGCLMFRPLPDKAAEQAACGLLLPEKDVDGMTAGSLAHVFMGGGAGQGAGYPPCTAQACMELLDHYGIELRGKRVTVVGRSLVFSRPAFLLLQGRDATVTMAHSKTADLPAVCREAEILVVAMGRAAGVDARFVSPGQVVIDVGINVDSSGKLCGDVKFDEVEPIVGAITPVPAGVGAVTTAVLAKHVIEAAERTLGGAPSAARGRA